MLDTLRIVVNLISLIINIGLAYFAVQLMRIFKGGTKEKPLRYISAGVLTIATGSSFFSLYYVLRLPSYVHPIGAIVAMTGGGLALIGLRKEYKIWTSTSHKKARDSNPLHGFLSHCDQSYGDFGLKIFIIEKPNSRKRQQWNATRIKQFRRKWGEDMKKLVYITLTSILALTLVEAYSTAHADRVEYATFEERLQGTVSGGMISILNRWIKITQQIITGIGDGTLPGSPVTFTIMTKIRYNEDLGKSFTSGNWTIVASDGQGSISGHFLGKGTEPDEFSGTFKSLNGTATGIYDGKKIYGEFQSRYLKPGPYGAPWRYEALWTGTVKGKD